MTFAAFDSASIQELVHWMGVKVLDGFPELAEVSFVGQNRLWDTAQVSEADAARAGLHRPAAAVRADRADARAMIVPARYNGPPDSANGG